MYLLEAKQLNSYKLWVPLSAQMPFFLQWVENPLQNGITAAIGAKLPTSLSRFFAQQFVPQLASKTISRGIKTIFKNNIYTKIFNTFLKG